MCCWLESGVDGWAVYSGTLSWGLSFSSLENYGHKKTRYTSLYSLCIQSKTQSKIMKRVEGEKIFDALTLSKKSVGLEVETSIEKLLLQYYVPPYF